MNLNISASAETKGSLAIQKILEDIPGGATLISADLKAATTDVLHGALVNIVRSTGACHLVKTAIVQAIYTGGATTIRVNKNHEFKVGEFISNGKVSTAITVITTTNAGYDTITLTAALDIENIAPAVVLYQGVSETSAVGRKTASTATVEDEIGKTLAIGLPDGTNGVKVTINQNSGDSLAITYTASTKTLLIRLASTTASKNNAATVQTALRVLSVQDGINFLDATATAGGGWDGTCTGATLTVASDWTTGGAPESDCPELYTANAVTLNDLKLNAAGGNNLLTGLMVRGTVIEANMPFGVHAKNKASLTSNVIFV